MNRRTFLTTTCAATATTLMSSVATCAGPLKGKVRKSLKWTMVKDRSLSIVDAFDKLRECGYEGVELRYADAAKNPDEWTMASEQSGLIIDGLVAVPPTEIEPAIDLCKKLGGDSLLYVARYDQQKPYWDSYRSTQQGLKQAAPHAQRQGVKLLVENVWASFLISPLDMRRYIDEIDHSHVAVHFDVGNVMRWGVPQHWVQLLGERIVKLDIKEYDLNKGMNEGMRAGFDTPIGAGTIDWLAVRNELSRIGFSGWAAAEVKGGDWPYLADVARRMDEVLDLT